MRLITLFILCFGFLHSTIGQRLEHIQGEFIVKLKEDVRPQDVKIPNKYLTNRSNKQTWSPIKNAPFNLHVLSFDFTQFSNQEVMRSLYQNDAVEYIQTNKLIKFRAEPNDSLFNRQWQYINTGINGGTAGADIDADRAWDITTGGVTALGDTIVALIIDDGYDVDHEDMIDNLWVNKAEIPGDGIDNDQNGFIDDIHGWNQRDNNNNISIGGSHGTPVAGIVGAKGNNMVGVAGVNWDVKLMIVKQSNLSESNVIEAYSYAYDKRKKYNETNGAEGDFVVSTNASWGIDQGDPDDSPIWCELYSVMGEEGILSCGATANANFNIDEVGDLPTGCTSDFLISVTNLNRNDEKVTSAGYGRVTIDLGAHGSQAYNVASNNRYGGFGGTSGATPHVTGAVALMYSVPCPELIALAKENPGLAARAVKEMILNTVDPIDQLVGISTARGRLNLGNAVETANNMCNDAGKRFGFLVENNTPGSSTFTWDENKSGLQTDIRIRKFEETTWTEFNNVQTPFTLDGLEICQQYEYQERTFEVGATNVPYGFSRFFGTIGCCFVSEIEEVRVENGSAIIILNNMDSDIVNTIEYRLYGSTEWLTQTGMGEIIIDNLGECELLEYRLTTLCNMFNTNSDTTSILNISGPCGDCTANSYCDVNTFNNDSEWIKSISINGESFSSGRNRLPYVQITGGYVPVINIGEKTLVGYEPDFSGASFGETFKIYMDLNKDGIFDETTELVHQSDGAVSELTIDTLVVPNDVNPGITRMRVMMYFGTGEEGPCGSGSNRFGEVEDYCVELSPNTSTQDFDDQAPVFAIVPSVTSELFNVVMSEEPYANSQLDIINMNGVLVQSITNIKTTITTLNASQWAPGTYIVRYASQHGIVTQKMIVL